MKKPLSLIASMLIGISALFVPSASMATVAPTITEYPSPLPYGITEGPDGNMWFAENNSANLGSITSSGVITQHPIPFSISAEEITTGSDGALWFAGGGVIGRMTTSGSFKYYQPSAHSFSGIATGPDGAVWFGEQRTNSIGRITTSGAITEVPLPNPGWIPTKMATGPDGAVWFTDNPTGGSDSGAIGRITPEGAVTEYTIPGFEARGYQITTGPDGALWFSESDYTGYHVGRVTTSGDFEVYPTPNNSSVTGIVTGPDGALWLSEYGSYSPNNGYIARMTTAGVVTDEYQVPTPGFVGASGITTGPAGSLWFVESIGKIGKIASDYTAPSVIGTPVGTPTAGWYNHDVTINWSATDPDSSATTPPPTTASLEGTNTYTSAPSCDPSNNCATGSQALSIDKTLPTVGSFGPFIKNALDPLTLTAPATDPVAASNGSAGSGVVAGEYYVDNTNPVAGSGIPMSSNGSTLSALPADNTLTNLAAGTHQIGVRAQDAAGNWSKDPVITQITFKPSAPTGLYWPTLTNTSPAISWSAVPGYTYNVYRQSSSDSSPQLVGSTSLASFADGSLNGILGTSDTYTYTVTAVAGGVEGLPSAGMPVDYDITLPGVTAVTLSPSTILSAQTATISATLSDTSGIKRAEYFIDSDPGIGIAVNMPNANGTATATIPSGLSVRTHTVYVRAEDGAGNWSVLQSKPLIVVNPLSIQLPQIQPVNATMPSGAYVNFIVTPHDGIGQATVTCTPASGSIFPVATTNVSCVATDEAGNTATGSFSVTVIGSLTQTQQLQNYISSNNIGPGSSLLAKLQAVLSDVQATPINITQTDTDLAKFTKEVSKESGKQITTAQATILLSDASAIQASYGG